MTKIPRTRIALGGAAAVLLFAGAALAQSTSNGMTSGPASGQPTTMGSEGTVPASPHQASTTKNGGGKSLKGEEGQTGGSGTSMPGKSDAGSGTTPSKGTNAPPQPNPQ